MKRAKFGLLAGLFVFSFLFASSQPENNSALVQIETTDGNRFVGEIISENAEKLVLLTENLGEISIQKKDIKIRKIIPANEVSNGQWLFNNPQSSRYFWAPNAYGLKKGEGYYHNILVLWNQFAYGISDNISIGGAAIPLFLFGGAPTPVFISPKISIPIDRDKFNVGAGALIGTVLGENESGFGIVYGVSTFGSRDLNISFGLGYGFASGNWASAPLINISGMARLSPRWYLVSENHFITVQEGGGGLISGGARWMVKKAALDFGLFVPAGNDIGTFIAIPWLGFTVPFGNAN